MAEQYHQADLKGRRAHLSDSRPCRAHGPYNTAVNGWPFRKLFVLKNEINIETAGVLSAFLVGHLSGAKPQFARA